MTESVSPNRVNPTDTQLQYVNELIKQRKQKVAGALVSVVSFATASAIGVGAAIEGTVNNGRLEGGQVGFFVAGVASGVGALTVRRILFREHEAQLRVEEAKIEILGQQNQSQNELHAQAEATEQYPVQEAE